MSILRLYTLDKEAKKAYYRGLDVRVYEQGTHTKE